MNVYLLKRGNLNFKTNKFEFYDDEIYSSKAKVLKNVENMIDVNNGYNVSREDVDFGSKPYLEVTYNCMSAPCVGEEAKPMRIRYCIYKMEVR
jgi:hypothetical protein